MATISRICHRSVQFVERVCDVNNVSIMGLSVMDILFDQRDCTFIGRGAYGSCTLACNTFSKWVVKMTSDDPMNVNIMLQEITALSALQDCPGVQQLIMVCPEALAMISQYGGEQLDKYLARHSCSEGQILDIVHQLTETLISIHEMGWTHLDVKCDNVTVCPSQAGLRVTLIDFGLALPIGQRHSFEKGNIVEHTAPEVLAGLPCSPASDVYSMARLLCRIMKQFDGPLFRWVRQGVRRNP
ncbi:uncharacterized protein [Panulirus ornatus]|uniref:uncharacterized protein n=1 Tax=Panulirus ornatus TaxID=150431 RepID=UPI003A89FCBB